MIEARVEWHYSTTAYEFDSVLRGHHINKASQTPLIDDIHTLAACTYYPASISADIFTQVA